jgi:hypothetical protein
MATAATEELAGLLERQHQLAAHVDQINADEREAVAAAREASERLVAIERAAAGGEKVSEAKRREAEDALLQARTAAAAPWSERRLAAELAARDARQAVAVFVGANLDALLTDIAVDGERAAAAIDAAAQALLDAYSARMEVEARTFALLATVRRPQPGDVARTRAEPVAREAERLLTGGGERAPDVLVRPGEPRHAEAVLA